MWVGRFLNYWLTNTDMGVSEKMGRFHMSYIQKFSVNPRKKFQ